MVGEWLYLWLGKNKMIFLKCFARDESGATAIEYGLIATLVAIGIISGLGILGNNVQTMFNNTADEVVKATQANN